jgi:hypothetical protein
MRRFRLFFHTVIVLIFLTGFSSSPASARIIRFSGYDWQVREDRSGNPGNNRWKGTNVWLDSNGNLHLKISKIDGHWYSAEVQTTLSLGFGEYQFQVVGRIDQLDPNIVLGLFSYPVSDGSDEIDIEYTKWGGPQTTSGNWAVYPDQSGHGNAHETFPISLDGTYTTNRYTWKSQQVFFQTLGGHQEDNTNELAGWIYKPSEPLINIPQQPMPVHINFWLFTGDPPLDGNEAEIIIHSFTFTPN